MVVINMKVKICGITNLSDALMAIAYGADEIGFNFFKESSRYIHPKTARNIIVKLPDHAIAVGVFVNDTIDHVQQIVQTTGIKKIQLHGQESSRYCRQFSLPIVKAIHTGMLSRDNSVHDYDNISAILFDSCHATQFGGTGVVSDWELAQCIAKHKSMYLAGGLHPGNIRQAINIVKPYAVDVCTGVESVPGHKSSELMNQFFSEIRRGMSNE